MLMQNFGVTDKEHYGMFWYLLEWSIFLFSFVFLFFQLEAYVHTNAEITILFTQRFRVERVLGHSGERIKKDAV